MIKCEVIENFTLEAFKQLTNVKKVEKRKENEFCIGDSFECTEKMADYLTGNNALNKKVVRIIEIEQPKKEVIVDSAEKQKKKKTSKK